MEGTNSMADGIKVGLTKAELQKIMNLGNDDEWVD